MLTSACPAIVLSSATRKKASLCGSSGKATRGFDPLLGLNFTESVLSYKPTTSSTAPDADLILRTFDAPSRLLHVRITFSQPFTTNFVAPLYNAEWSLGNGASARFLNIPLDNDMQSMYESVVPESIIRTSSFATAIFEDLDDGRDLKAGRGLIVGFLEHDLFKSGIAYNNQKLSAVAGINGEWVTRDQQPHGMVTLNKPFGTEASQLVATVPLLSLGVYEDWRDGMEEFASTQRGRFYRSPQQQGKGAEAALPFPARPVPLPAASGMAGIRAGPIAGWNSWSMAAAHLGQPNISNMFAVSDVLAQVASKGFGPQVGS
jgi:hypothetical protein